MSKRIHNALKFLIILVFVNHQIALPQSFDFKLSTPMIDSLIKDFVYNEGMFSQTRQLRKMMVLVEVRDFKSEFSDTLAIEVKNIHSLQRMASKEIVSVFFLDDWIACFMSVSNLKTGVFFPPVETYKAFIKKITTWNYLTWFGEYDTTQVEWINTPYATGCTITYHYRFYAPINEEEVNKDYRNGIVKYQYVEKRIEDGCSGRKELIKYEFDNTKNLYRVLRK